MLDALARLMAIHWRERQLLLDAALLETDMTKDAEALERFRAELDDDEVRVVRALVSRRASALSNLLLQLDDDDVTNSDAIASSKERLVQELQGIASEREAILREALQGASGDSEAESHGQS
jgi:hypothetical protein